MHPVSASVPAPSEAPSPSSTQISAPGTGSSLDDPLEIVPDSEDDKVVQIPAPRLSTWSHWGQGGLETGDYMLGTFRAHVHLSHNVTGG